MRRFLPLAFMLTLSLAACGSYNEGANSGAGGANGAGGAGAMGPGGMGGAGAGAGAGAYGSATPGSEQDLVQTVGDRIFFHTDRSTLDEQARATLDKQAAWLQRYPTVRIMIAGNCDERGTEEFNLALGQRRADADKDYLIAHGIAPSRIQTISYGKDRPTVPGSTPEAWAQNRNAITMVQ